MLTLKVKRRIIYLSIFCFTICLCFFYVIKTLNQSLLYFKTPSEIFDDQNLDLSKEIRLGGMVKKNSIKVNKREIQFIITDLKKEILVSYKGTVPNLFLEEKGVIAEGKLKDKKFFIANRVLAKHDENYKPPSENQLDKK